MANPGPASTQTVNVTLPVGNLQLVESLKINLGTIAAIPTISTSEITFSGLGTGILAGDVILAINKPTQQAGLGICNFRVDPLVNDKFYIAYVNPTAAGITPTAAELYTVVIGRPTQSNGALSAIV